jgi:DNA repair protein RecO
MHEERTEAIVLRSQDFKERHRIITLFSPQGLISLIVKNISKKNTRLLTLTTPFCYGEYLYRIGASELFTFQDGTILNPHLELRQSLTSLETAGNLAHAILSSQFPGKPALPLFLLYRSYHQQTASFNSPATLLASFYLKILKYEGLIHLTTHCLHCGIKPACLLFNGESLCPEHRTPDALHFSPEEWELLLALDGAQQFSTLRQLFVPLSLSQKLSRLFHSRLSH